MSILFLNGVPAIMVEKERAVAVGDLHIGIEEKFSESGISFPRAAENMALELKSICEENKSKEIVLLGDVKHGITNITKDELSSLRSFFKILEGIRIRIAKGNHDAYLEQMLLDMGMPIEVKKEILLEDVALMHGNAMPSEEAVMKKYIVCGHGHIAAQINGMDKKAWLVSPIGEGMKDSYKDYNKDIRLVAAPAFNRLIIGSRLGYESEEHIPLLNNKLFDFARSKIYDLYGNSLKD